MVVGGRTLLLTRPEALPRWEPISAVHSRRFYASQGKGVVLLTTHQRREVIRLKRSGLTRARILDETGLSEEELATVIGPAREPTEKTLNGRWGYLSTPVTEVEKRLEKRLVPELDLVALGITEPTEVTEKHSVAPPS
jgi:hypothetical protein